MRAILCVLGFTFIVWLFLEVVSPVFDQIVASLK